MIQVENLSIQNQDKTLIKNLSIQFNKGEIWAIIGQNGSGKTTLLHTIAGFSPKYGGQIFINSTNIRELSSLKKAQMIALLPQQSEAHLDCSVRQNISYARYAWNKNNLQETTERTLINKALNVMELQHLQDKSVNHISGGEQQRVEIATVIAQNSELILLDEPFNHLDIIFRNRLMQYLQKIQHEKFIIISTHDIHYVEKYCSHVLLLIDDKHILQGKVQDILTATNMQRIFGNFF